MKRIALVTGASRGIGRAIANRLATDGVEVIGLARNPCADFPGNFYTCDVGDLPHSGQLFQEICQRHGVNIVVNNAGAVAVESAADVTSDALDLQWHVHVNAAVLAAQAALPQMRKQNWGRIVSIASGAVLGKVGRTGYAASKAAQIGMTRTLSMELGPLGVTVNCVAPGQVQTEMWSKNNDPESAKTKAMIASIPARRLGTPEDVANAVGFLVSEAASYINGQTLFVCGGLTVGRTPI